MQRTAGFLMVGLMALALAGCAGPSKPKPAELAPAASLLAVKKVWSASIGVVAFPLEVKQIGSNVYMASSSGVISSFDAETGAVLWTAELGKKISAGVGADGEKTAVVTTDGELVVFQQGKRIWQQKLTSVAVTPPLIAGGRVFVITPDRSLFAFDSETGKRLWQQQRGADSLVLDRAAVLFPAGDTLIAGIGGRLVGVNPLTGAQRWDVPVSVSRGTNEVDRLVDLMPGVSRVGSDVCLRAYQNSVACVSLSNQKVLWSRAANGFTGVSGDDKVVFGTEADGRLIAWRRADGEVVWQLATMKWRELGTPLLLGETLAVPDSAGFVHLLSKSDGSTLGRLALDGSPLGASPVLAGKTLVVVTQKGGVFAFRPE